MPQESLWVQFSVVAILLLAMSLVWSELKKFIDEQDAKRDAEREKQRVWQAKQDDVRDSRWQDFLKSMQDEWIKQDGRNNQTINDLIAKVDKLIRVVHNHDRITQQSIAVMHERTTKPLRAE